MFHREYESLPPCLRTGILFGDEYILVAHTSGTQHRVLAGGWTAGDRGTAHCFTGGRRNAKESSTEHGVSLRYYTTVAHGSLLSRESTTCFTDGVDGRVHDSARHSRDLPVARRNVVKRNGYKHRPPPLGHGQYGVALTLAAGKLTGRENATSDWSIAPCVTSGRLLMRSPVKATPRAYTDRRDARLYNFPETPMQKILYHTWTEHLHQKSISPEIRFSYRCAMYATLLLINEIIEIPTVDERLTVVLWRASNVCRQLSRLMITPSRSCK